MIIGKIRNDCAALALIVAASISACAPETKLQSSTDYSSCQIIYSPIPHASSAHVVGQAQLDRIFALTNDDKRRFFRSLSGITESAIRATMDPAAKWELQPVQEVLGGYEGETTPSISLPMRSPLDLDISQLERVASAIGYVYVQDSVLVQCADDGVENASDAVTVVVKDAGRRTFLNADNVPFLFGMMIALNNGPGGLGYTYYPNTGRFETLEDEIETGAVAKMLQDISRQLRQLSHNDILLEISTEKLDVSFPHNSWSVARRGESYLSELPSAADRQVLAEHRRQFLLALDSFLGLQSSE